MLNALAMIIADEFPDLAMFVLTFVEGDADLVVRGCHGATEETGRLSFYVEITNLAEIEDPLIIIRPIVHPSAFQIMRQMVERMEADAVAVLAGAGLRDEIDIIDFLRAIAIHKIKVRAANALNSGNVEFHWSGFAFYRRSAPLDRQLERLGRIMYPEGHGIGGRSMH